MNALHQLSRRYFKKEISQQDYRLQRRELITSILSGQFIEQNSITNVPDRTQSETTQKMFKSQLSNPDAHESSVPKSKKRAPKKKSPVLIIFLTSMLLAFVSIFVFRSEIRGQLTQHAPGVLAVIEQIQILPKNQAEVSQLPALKAEWQRVLLANQMTEFDVSVLSNLWEKASEEDKQEFSLLLKAYVYRWGDDFDKEIEVGITYQLIQTLNIQT